MDSECFCQLYNMEDFEDNGFCLGCLPADKFDPSYMPKIVENIVEAKNVRLHSYVDFIGNTRKPPSLRTTQLMMKCCSIDAEE